MTKREIERKKCLKCLKEKNKEKEFYLSYSEWNGDGKIPYCKTCLKENLNENSTESVNNILRVIDRPFKRLAWEKALNNKNDTLGTYLKDIALNYKTDTWADSDSDAPKSNTENTAKTEHRTLKDEYVKEDRFHSKKWLGYYTPSEIEYLEDYVLGLDRDFRVVTTSHIDYAMKIAKASLHMDKCFQEMLDGVNGADKRYRDAKDVFDTLSKSAKFSESQRGLTDVGMGSISQIVEMVESETYVYEHKNDLDKDMYDQLLDDFKHINKSL